jgi:hypothetical protein
MGMMKEMPMQARPQKPMHWEGGISGGWGGEGKVRNGRERAMGRGTYGEVTA